MVVKHSTTVRIATIWTWGTIFILFGKVFGILPIPWLLALAPLSLPFIGLLMIIILSPKP